MHGALALGTGRWYVTGAMDVLLWIWRAFAQVFYFLFFTFWGWMILLFVLVPALRGRFRVWGRRRTFYRARQAELGNPRNAGARFQLGVIHYEGRQLRRALRFFREAVTISETNGTEIDPKLYQYLGHTLRRLGHHREAILAYEAGLDEDPDSGRGDSETGVALAHQRLGELDEAERWYRRAVERNTSLLEPRLRLATLQERRGDAAESSRLLTEAREIRLPDFARKRQRRWRLVLLLYPLVRYFL